MAKVTYDNTGVESGGGGGDEQPKPGVYVAEIVKAEVRETKSDGSPANDVHVTLNLGANYAWVHSYIGLDEASDWKLAEFTRALGLKEKGAFDTDKLKGKVVRTKINADSYENEYRGKPGRFMKAESTDKVLPPIEKDESADPAETPDAEPDADPDAEAATETGFVPTREDDDNKYDEWSDEDLEGEAEDRGLTIPGGRGAKKTKLLTALRADDEAAAGGGGGDEGETPEAAADGPEDDYDTWEPELLENEVKERQLDLPKKPRGSGAADRYKEALIAILRQDDLDNPFDPEAE